ncbi:MAG: hypothetical protein AAF611_05800 [Bacteroidota bacterium]
MIRHILIVFFCLIGSSSFYGQSNEEIAKKFIKAHNEQDIKTLQKLTHRNFKVSLGDIQKQGMAHVEKNRSLNTKFSNIKVVEASDTSITLFVTTSNDYRTLMEMPPVIDKHTYIISRRKIKQIIIEYSTEKNSKETLNDADKKQRAFDKWLAKRGLLLSDFPETKKGSAMLINFVKQYKELALTNSVTTEIQTFTKKVIDARKADFTRNDIKGFKAFSYEVLIAHKNNDYDALLKLYITEKEFIEMCQYYRRSPLFGKHEYDENARTIDKERFEYLNGNYFYKRSIRFELIGELDIEPVPFSKILNQKPLKKKPEYYFLNDNIKVYSYQNSHKKKKKDIRLCETIYIPNKGWRLLNYRQ